ncbi:MAG: helix-turn-helix domain-containing protein [Pseudomonadota bacterium]
MTINKISSLMTDDAILLETGRRLARQRVDRQLTQSALAEQAGVSKRTVERIEAGESAQLASVIRVLRVLELLPGFDAMLPEIGPRPMDLLRLQGKARQRASSSHKAVEGVREEPAWRWGDEPDDPAPSKR